MPLLEKINGVYHYGDWRIQYAPKPIPDFSRDWDYWHDDYDGAEDSNDDRAGSAASPDACIEEIEEIMSDD